MELKDIGPLLRSHADLWIKMGAEDDNETDVGRGYASAQRNHGKTLNDLLNMCDVPELEDETE